MELNSSPSKSEASIVLDGAESSSSIQQGKTMNSRQRRLLRRKAEREKKANGLPQEKKCESTIQGEATAPHEPKAHKRNREETKAEAEPPAKKAATDASVAARTDMETSPAEQALSERNVPTAAAPPSLSAPAAAVPVATLDVAAHAPPAWRKPITFKHRFICGPMVDASELAFRMMVRSYNTDCCFTPMFYSQKFATDEKYRTACWQSCPEDRPLVVQFCANDAKVLLAAAKLVEDKCDAVDINLGCPLKEARNQRYGAYLLDAHEHACVLDMVQTVSRELKIPLTCKIRLLPTIEETINFALKLQAAGCAMLTVHARHRTKPREKRVGPAKLDWVIALKKVLTIPVITNGNTRSFRDVKRNLGHTKADGLMSAEGLLANPAIFSNQKPDCLMLGTEYLMFAEKYAAPFKWALRHVNKMCKQLFIQYDLHSDFGKCTTLDEARRMLVSCMVRRDAESKGMAVANFKPTSSHSGAGSASASVDRSLPGAAKAHGKPRGKPRQRMALTSGHGSASTGTAAAAAGDAVDDGTDDVAMSNGDIDGLDDGESYG